MRVYKDLFFQVYRYLPSQVDAMTLADYALVKRHTDGHLVELRSAQS